MHNGKVNMMDRELMPALINNVQNLVDDGAKGTLQFQKDSGICLKWILQIRQRKMFDKLGRIRQNFK